MDIVCFDMEGTLTPEIWEQVALDSGISELRKTTRDISSYSDLMDCRIEIMKQHNLKLADIVEATKKLDLLDGALDFLNQVRQEFQVVILSDTFHEIAYPLMEKIKESIKKQYNGDPENLVEIVVAYDVSDYRIFIKLRDGQEKELERINYP